MIKRFRELLLSIQEQTMTEQKDFLIHEIEKWKGKHKQTDDILVVGIRI